MDLRGDYRKNIEIYLSSSDKNNRKLVSSSDKKSNCWMCKTKFRHDITQITEEETGNIFISDLSAAKCEDLIKRHKINAVVNVSTVHYTPHTDHILEHDILDMPDQVLEKGFNKIYKFMETHLSAGTNVLVHCQAGISRSVSYVCYYLMRSRNILFDDALEIVSAKRDVTNPNYAFKKQLRAIDFAFDAKLDEMDRKTELLKLKS
jgi:protein-tyrosine phosphatase